MELILRPSQTKHPNTINEYHMLSSFARTLPLISNYINYFSGPRNTSFQISPTTRLAPENLDEWVYTVNRIFSKGF